MYVLYDALKKWIDAFNQFGLKLSLSPAQPPDEGAPTADFSGRLNIKFCWGDVSDAGGRVSVGGTGGFWNNRTSSVVLTLSNNQMWYVLPRGHGRS